MFLIAALAVLLILNSPWNLIVSGACLVGFAFEVGFWNLKVRGKRKRVGAEALINAEGTVLTPCRPVGQVQVVGERWEARCDEGADPGEKVRVIGIVGLTLTVEKVA
jgi:membrane protein implicated in regulation of membrane protease activity